MVNGGPSPERGAASFASTVVRGAELMGWGTGLRGRARTGAIARLSQLVRVAFQWTTFANENGFEVAVVALDVAGALITVLPTSTLCAYDASRESLQRPILG